MEPNGDGRITLAVIQRDIQHLTSMITAYIEDSEKCHRDHEMRLRSLEGWRPQVEEKQRTSTGLLAAFTIVVTAIGAGIASLFK
jgi:hypothetical protein